jgi:hypothetical protein
VISEKFLPACAAIPACFERDIADNCSAGTFGRNIANRVRSKHVSKNGEMLRKLIADANIEAEEALTIWNRGKTAPLSLDHWLAYMIEPTNEFWKPCPDSVVLHMQVTLCASYRSNIPKNRK